MIYELAQSGQMSYFLNLQSVAYVRVSAGVVQGKSSVLIKFR